MGGLVSRSFIEQGNGNEVVSHLIMVGTPNNGSPWATVHDLATTLLSFGLNLFLPQDHGPILPQYPLEKLAHSRPGQVQQRHQRNPPLDPALPQMEIVLSLQISWNPKHQLLHPKNLLQFRLNLTQTMRLELRNGLTQLMW
jgi:hypothetical protein